MRRKRHPKHTPRKIGIKKHHRRFSIRWHNEKTPPYQKGQWYTAKVGKSDLGSQFSQHLYISKKENQQTTQRIKRPSAQSIPLSIDRLPLLSINSHLFSFFNKIEIRNEFPFLHSSLKLALNAIEITEKKKRIKPFRKTFQ